jgi:riboflavin biosynthesis pyrimidine reductase
VRFTRLTPGGDAPAHELLAEIGPRERAREERPFLVVNMVASADGRATVDGRTGGLGGGADLEMLLELRASADAVLIGSGTLLAESYARLLGNPERRARRVAAGLPEDPTAVLVTRTGALPWDAGLFRSPEQPVLVYGDVEAPPVAAPVEVVRMADPSLAEVFADLRARGVRALLSEGGPRLFRSLLEAGLVDELFLTITPELTGDPTAIRIVEGLGLPEPVKLELLWVLESDGELFLRYSVGSPA